MNLNTTEFHAPEGYYRAQAQEKHHIVLHFTAGYSARGCYGAFRTHKNGTAFIVDRDGTVYQYFEPQFWASHLFRHKKGEDPALYQLEKSSIGIEIANVGPLTLDETRGKLLTYTDKDYCDLEETAKYVKADYRGKHYWASFTEQQYSSVMQLVQDLSRDFLIDIRNYSAIQHKWLEQWEIPQIQGYRGLTNHGNYRKDKYDIGPGFIMDRMFTFQS